MFEEPKLLFHAEFDRKPYFRRFMWMVLGAVAALGATLALAYAGSMGRTDGDLTTIGQIVGIVVVVLLVLRALLNLRRWLFTRTESLRFYDRGFVWERGGERYKYRYSQVRSFREGVRSLYLFGRPLIQIGAHTLKMRDGRTFRIRGRHGDTRRIAKLLRRRIATVTGERMAQALRNNKVVRVHRKLRLTPRGLVAGKHKIPWSQADVRLKGRRLHVRRLNDKGKFKTVRKYGKQSINNLGGFMEVATTTIRNHQPDRFHTRVARGEPVARPGA